MNSSGLIVTGSDTGVGKTLVTAGLCAWLAREGHRVCPLKPVESGTEESRGIPLDAELLARSAGLSAGSAAVNIFSLPEPLAPVVAARRAGVSLSMEPIDSAVEQLKTEGVVVVEGVGGTLVEMVEGVTVADLPRRWDLPVLVVAANRLGVLSHTLLSVESLLTRGAVVTGVVLNETGPWPGGLAQSTNGPELERLLPVGIPLLGRVEHLSKRHLREPKALAAAVAPWADRAFGLKPG